MTAKKTTTKKTGSNPAARLLALLLGHEARITDEQWSEVRAMACTRRVDLMYEGDLPKDISKEEYDKWFQQSVVYDGVRVGPCLPGTPVSRRVEVLEVCDSPATTPPPCPACEAAARELADLHALCERQAAILSRVAVVLRGPEPPQTKWGHHDLPERAERAVADAAHYRKRWADSVLMHTDAVTQRDDLRARLAALASELPDRHWPRTSDAGSASEQIAAELRALLRKEAK